MDAATRAAALYDELELDALPPELRRDSLRHYYLSVWPGLLQLPELDPDDVPPRPGPVRSAYVHLPFCSGLCDFCSYFVTVAHDDARIARYVDALLAEVDLHRERAELDVSLLYLGGGTPSLVPPAQLDRLLGGLRDRGVLSDEPLLGTVELHPELFADEARADAFLDVVQSHGIGRVSIGFETDDDALLAATNRRHAAAAVTRAVERVKERGLLFNLDLMYGLPGQSLASWTGSLDAALALDPDSVSTYFTFVDPWTRLWQQVRRGEVTLPGHREVQIQHLAAQLTLEDAGFNELPNDFWSRGPDPATLAQQTLPSDANSLGLGAGAYAFHSGTQTFNHFALERYHAAIEAGRLPLWRGAVLEGHAGLVRDVMFTLKNEPALDLRLFAERNDGSTPLGLFPEVFGRLFALALVDLDGQVVRLTRKGRLMVEEIACLFEPPGHHAPTEATGAERKRLERHNFAPTYSLA